MVYFGLDGITEYNKDTVYRERNDADASDNDPSKSSNYSDRYKIIIQSSNYGMWAKWYETYNGWHRGIDMNYLGAGYDIYSIIYGEVVAITSYYISIYTKVFNITTTYMHLAISPDYQVGDFVPTGALIGTQSSNGTDKVHTHVEFNNGSYTSPLNRPWSTQNGETPFDPKVHLIKPGELISGVSASKMSLNPYPIIESILEKT